jgi:hypothetical protein
MPRFGPCLCTSLTQLSRRPLLPLKQGILLPRTAWPLLKMGPSEALWNNPEGRTPQVDPGTNLGSNV